MTSSIERRRNDSLSGTVSPKAEERFVVGNSSFGSCQSSGVAVRGIQSVLSRARVLHATELKKKTLGHPDPGSTVEIPRLYDVRSVSLELLHDGSQQEDFLQTSDKEETEKLLPSDLLRRSVGEQETGEVGKWDLLLGERCVNCDQRARRARSS